MYLFKSCSLSCQNTVVTGMGLTQDRFSINTSYLESGATWEFPACNYRQN